MRQDTNEERSSERERESERPKTTNTKQHKTGNLLFPFFLSFFLSFFFSFCVVAHRFSRQASTICENLPQTLVWQTPEGPTRAKSRRRVCVCVCVWCVCVCVSVFCACASQSLCGHSRYCSSPPQVHPYTRTHETNPRELFVRGEKYRSAPHCELPSPPFFPPSLVRQRPKQINTKHGKHPTETGGGACWAATRRGTQTNHL